MSTAFEFVARQMDLYENQAEEWKVNHEEVKSCWNLEDALRFGVMLFSAIGARNKRSGKVMTADALEVCRLYQQWIKTAERYVGPIQEMENKGFSVDGVDDFRECYTKVLAILSQVNVIDKSLRDILEGKGTSLDEAERMFTR